jgi:hypothetical protein
MLDSPIIRIIISLELLGFAALLQDAPDWHKHREDHRADLHISCKVAGK